MPWPTRILVCILFLLSGATALVYEVVWTRDLSLIFGASHQAVSIVLGSFMGGLALGGWFFGRRAQQTIRALRLYGLLELGVAACALALPSLLRLADGLYVTAARQADGVTWWLTLMRVVLAFAILVLPTFFMGGTLPILTRYVVRRLGELPVGLSVLYGINTAGAVAGTVAAGFFLLRLLGMWNTQLVAVAVNVLIGAVAILADRPLPPPPPENAGPAPSQSPSSAALPATQMPDLPRRALALRLAFYGTAVSGLAALGLEVMWTRGIAVCSGTTTYSFTIMLAAFLTGITLGSWIHSLMPLRRIDESVQFGAVIALIGLSSLVVSQSMPRLPELALLIDQWLYADPTHIHLETTLVLSFLVMLAPCMFMGMAFPLAGQARARLQKSLGQAVGDTVSFNTLGAIAGSLLAGFVLIPYIGLQRGMLMLGGLNLGYGALVLGAAALPARSSSMRYPAACAAVIAAALSLAAAPLALPRWDISVLGVFQNNKTGNYINDAGEVAIRQRLPAIELLYYREGRGANVSVVHDQSGTRSLLINGKSVATQSPTDLHHELMLGHVPALLHPNPRSAAVIGLGAGITAGGVAAHSSIKDLTVVEIEPAVVDAAALFGQTNGDVVRDPRFHLVVQDGRNFLLTTNRTFDIITADPIHPWTRGSTYLFTAEYYQLCRQRLTEGGVMCQWLPLYELSLDNVKSIVATFASSFPHISVWLASADLVLIGSAEPITVDLGELARRIKQPAVAQQLDLVGLADPLSFLADCVMDDEAVRRFIEGAILNTDDNLAIEFAAPMSVAASVLLPNVEAVLDVQSGPGVLIRGTSPVIESPLQTPGILAQYRQAKKRTVVLSLDGLMAADKGAEEKLLQVIASLRKVVSDLPSYGQPRFFLSQFLIELGKRQARSGVGDALATFRLAAEADARGAEPHALLGDILAVQGKFPQAAEEFEQALQRSPHHVEAHANLGLVLVSMGRNEEALGHLDEAMARSPRDADSRFNAGTALAQLGRHDEAVARFREALTINAKLAPARESLAAVLDSTGRTAEARDVLREGIQLEPDNVSLLTRLAWMMATNPDDEASDGREALRLAEHAAAAGKASPQILATLAAAQAAAGRFDDAAQSARKAAELADQLGSAAQAALIRTQLRQYEAGKRLGK